MSEIATFKSRILQYLDFKGVSKYECYQKTGITNGVFSKKEGLSEDNLSRFISYYRDISAEWLLSGRGKMLTTDASPAISNLPIGVPYYDVDFCGGFDLVLNDQTIIPTGYINLPQYSGADSWANITGHSMEPLISNGDIIALHKIEDWQTYLLYGEIYGIMTDEYRTVKRIRKASSPDYILLEPANKDYDEQEIPKHIIRGIWQVLGSVKRFV